MSVNIYPAYLDEHKCICHADNWDNESTLNIANGNFYSLVDTMKMGLWMDKVPGQMPIKVLESALDKAPSTNYTNRLKKICAIARVKRVNLIAFS